MKLNMMRLQGQTRNGHLKINGQIKRLTKIHLTMWLDLYLIKHLKNAMWFWNLILLISTLLSAKKRQQVWGPGSEETLISPYSVAGRMWQNFRKKSFKQMSKLEKSWSKDVGTIFWICSVDQVKKYKTLSSMT